MSTIKISGFADEIHKDFHVQLAVLKELGQNYIEFRSADGIGVANMTEEQILNYKGKLDEAGIKVSAIGSPIGKIMITDAFNPHFETFRSIVRYAKIMDTPYIRMFSFFIPSGEQPEKYRDEVHHRLKLLIEYAKENQVILLHENEKDIYGDNAARCKDLMDAFYCENFQFTFDFANFVQCHQDTMEAYKLLESNIAYIHIKDASMNTGRVVLPGNGDGNVWGILNMLYDKGFDGFLSLEPHLTTFAILDQLELSQQEKKELDGTEAYRMAYRQLTSILDEIGLK